MQVSMQKTHQNAIHVALVALEFVGLDALARPNQVGVEMVA